MDYVTFCQDYYAATSIPVSLSSGSDILYTAVGSILNLTSNAVYSAPCELDNCPQFSHYNPEIEYGIVQIDNTDMAIVIGPVFETEITHEVVNAYMRENLIPLSEKERVFEFLCTIPKLSHLQMAKHMILIHQAINHRSCELTHFFGAQTSSPESQKMSHLPQREDTPEEFYNTYTNEIRLYEIIKMGNEAELKEYLRTTPLNLLVKPLAKSPLRQAKNMFINTITNVVMIGAIPGGVAMNDAYELMGSYVQDCENLQSISEIETLRYNMIVHFCQLSAKSKIPKGVSSEVFTCMSFIRSHTNDSISVEDVAAYIGRSPSYVTKRFRTELDITPGSFISRCKLEEAKSLLIFSEKNLAEISNYLCYSSQGYFQNSFKKKFGMTPQQFRKKMRNVD